MGELPKQVISMLCEVDDTVRPEIAAIASHAWFKDVDMAALLDKSLEPPWLPPVENDFDVSLLHESDEEEEDEEDESEPESEGESEGESEEDADPYDSEEADELESNEYGEIFKPFRSSSVVSATSTRSVSVSSARGSMKLGSLTEDDEGS